MLLGVLPPVEFHRKHKLGGQVLQLMWQWLTVVEVIGQGLTDVSRPTMQKMWSGYLSELQMLWTCLLYSTPYLIHSSRWQLSRPTYLLHVKHFLGCWRVCSIIRLHSLAYSGKLSNDDWVPWSKSSAGMCCAAVIADDHPLLLVTR